MKFRFLVTFDVPTDIRNGHLARLEDIPDWQHAVEKASRDLIPTEAGAVWIERFEDSMLSSKMISRAYAAGLRSGRFFERKSAPDGLTPIFLPGWVWPLYVVLALSNVASWGLVVWMMLKLKGS